MTNLLARLNTYESLSAATSDEKRYGQGVYVDFGDEGELYKNVTFKELINKIVERALESGEQKYKEIASCVQTHMSRQVPQIRIGIRAYDPESDEFIRKTDDERSIVIGLDEKVKDYITEKEMSLNGEVRKVDYLDIVMTLTTWD